MAGASDSDEVPGIGYKHLQAFKGELKNEIFDMFGPYFVKFDTVVKHLEKESETLKEKLQDKEKELQQWKDQLAVLEKKLNDKHEQLMAKENEETRKKKDDMETKIRDLNAIIQVLQTELAEKNEALEKERESLRHLNSKAFANQDFEAKEKAIYDLKLKNKTADKNLDKAKAELGVARAAERVKQRNNKEKRVSSEPSLKTRAK